MKTMELDTCRIELIRDILATDDLQVLRTVRRAYRRAVNKMMKSTDADNLPAYTMEELNVRLDEAEAEDGGTSSAEFFSQMEREMPWLCK
ncbi:hypothetical protein [Bacteroides uniformis]|uniref:hypothetical protein n=1 Tax=Bacteroides uniformis TaxID=820 RepID=UPI00189994E3|nr:hypothetical protein [Bacteroides uniformis]